MSLDNRDFEQEFIDSSWEHMRSLLDAEKPVEKKRDYRFLYLLMFLLLSTSLWYLSSPNDIKEDIAPIQLASIADLAQSTEIKPLNETTNQVLIQNSDASIQSIDLNSSNSSPSIGSTFQTKEKDTPAIQGKSNAIVENLRTSDKQNSVAQILSIKNASKLNTPINKIEQIALLDNIDSKLTVELRQAKSKAGKIQLIEKKEKIKAISSVGLVSAVSTNSYFAGAGLSLNVNFPISDRFSVYTGTDLVFNNKIRDYIQTPPKNIIPLEPEKPIDPSITNHFDNYDSGVDIVTPLGISYSATSNFALSAGINHRYNIYNKLIIDNTNGKNGLRYNRQFLSPTFGLSYNMGPKAHIAVSYEHGLKSFLNSEYSTSALHRNSYISLSTRFYLN